MNVGKVAQRTSNIYNNCIAIPNNYVTIKYEKDILPWFRWYFHNALLNAISDYRIAIKEPININDEHFF